ncbi:MAG: tRNA lysidine(34) synthetase TilS [Opitutaceae bacterium]|nr:tRNA lysidine(34) synthetase TilS [Opitutaceae bacterium]
MSARSISPLREAAAKLAAIIPRERLDAAVRAWADSASRRTRWAVALSGGADSLALLLLIWAHWPERRRTLRALHFDHRLRGSESRGDARYCARVCRELDLELVRGTWRGKNHGASEATARAARMAFFEKYGRTIWLGHQQDDIAESMLMRLARGSGAAGLAAPRPVQALPGGRVHVRPLLGLKRAEIEAALRAAGVSWRTDSSNEFDEHFRNRVRRRVVPAWVHAAQRDAVAGAARSRALLEEDDAALEAWVDSLWPTSAARRVLPLASLAGKPRALWRRALHRWLRAQPRAGELSSAAFESLLAAIQRGPTRQSAGVRGFVVSDGSEVRFQSVRKYRR